jgi:hypothetical protein
MLLLHVLLLIILMNLQLVQCIVQWGFTGRNPAHFLYQV